MIIATFKTPEGEYNTYVYNNADDLQFAIEVINSTDAVTGVWEVNGWIQVWKDLLNRYLCIYLL